MGGIKVELNDRGDFITIQPASNFYAQAAGLFKQIDRMGKEFINEYEKVQNDAEKDSLDKIKKAAKMLTGFSEKVVEMIDGVFGEKTIRNYFYRQYEADPCFLPDAECFQDFMDNMTSVFNRIFGNKGVGAGKPPCKPKRKRKK